MKNFSIFILLIISKFCYSQTFVQGTITDAKTKTALPFCNVSIKGTSQGCISNEDGVYKISVKPEKDSLIFSYVGYKTQIISVSVLLQHSNVNMESNSIGLKEIVVVADDDFLYGVIEQCRKKIQAWKQQTTKVYFQLETEIQEQPVEMLECYYNGYLNGSAIEKLLLKNGRIGLAETKDNGFFNNLNTSKAISYLNLIEKNEYLPSIPLQFNKSKLKKLYFLKRIFDDDNSYHIEFTPIKNKGSFFSGEIWIDEETFSILNINLNCENTVVHPFLPSHAGGSLDSVCLYVTQSYKLNGNESSLNHINFKYLFKFNNGQPLARTYNGSNSDYKVNSSGVMFFYDYNKLFQLPYFDYDINESDYRKITSMPYNELFWKDNLGLLFTEKQKQSLEFFNNNGVLVNYSNKKSKVKGNYNVFQDNNIFWSDTNRIALKKDNLDSLLHKNPLLNKNGQYLASDLYNLNVQIFLDINPSVDFIQHYSTTVFDISQSYYELPPDTNTNCFLNIYFDIWEIGRQQMEKVLSLQSWNIQQIDSIYKQTVTNLNQQSKNYFKEVQLGSNKKEFHKWNTYVLQNLNIDNQQIFAGNDK